MSKRQTKIRVRLNVPDLQIKLQQENQILFLKCHSSKTEHKRIEDRYRAHIKKNNKELEELFSSF